MPNGKQASDSRFRKAIRQRISSVRRKGAALAKKKLDFTQKAAAPPGKQRSVTGPIANVQKPTSGQKKAFAIRQKKKEAMRDKIKRGQRSLWSSKGFGGK
ncbi:hypothetical protein CMI37_36395 [Candidatus Pacearchaeota archaeon]|nr:hypothetical protein [Candidatus Pacearchaeota archaeon]|tara:strand:- start:2212 stop:2511 length:300 start_codon:yes stop_codon:yes gene_type:complete